MAKKKKETPYAQYSEKTQKFMGAILEFLNAKFGAIETQWWGILDMMATQYELFCQCKQSVEENGILVENRWGVMDKNPLLKQMNDCQIQIVKLVNEFGLSPKSIKSLNTISTENEEFIKDLTE